MGKLIRVLAVLVVLSVVASYAGAVTIKPGTYQLKWRILKKDEQAPTQIYLELGTMSAAEKKRFVGLPSGDVYWGEQSGVVLVLAKKKPSDEQFNTAYVLTDAPAEGKVDLKSAVQISLSEGSWSSGGGPSYPHLSPGYYAKPVLIAWAMGEGADRIVEKAPAQISVDFEPDENGTVRPVRADVGVRGEWFGTVNTDEGTLDVRTIDWSGDRTYDDVEGLNGTGDTIELTDGEEETHWFSDKGVLHIGEASSYDGKLYRLKVSSAGDKVEVQPYTGPTGSLKLEVVNAENQPTNDFEVYLAGDHGWYVFDSADITVPPGEYRVTVNVRDGVTKPGPGDKFYCGTNINPRIGLKVEAGKTLARRFGGPMLISIEPDTEIIEARPGEDLDIRLDFSIGGDAFGISGSSTPKVRVKNASGKVIYKGDADFTYCEEDSVHTLKVPDSWKPGDYTLTVTLDAKPYQEKVTASKTLRITK